MKILQKNVIKLQNAFQDIMLF